MMENTSSTYGSVAKFFHWLIFILVFFMIIYGLSLGYIPKDYQGLAYNIHKLTGLSILLLMLLRGLWALMNVKPQLPFNTPDWQRVAERIVHYLLYAALIAMPLAGWIGTSSAGKPPHIGNFALQLPIAKNEDLIKNAFYIHNTLALVIVILVSIHILAAFYHHFIKRDSILRRMLPNSTTY